MKKHAFAGLTLLFSLLPIASISAGIGILGETDRIPALIWLDDMGHTPWGRWLKEDSPLPCYSTEPGSCRGAKIYLALSNFDLDEPKNPVFATSLEYDWTILGYRGELYYLAEGQPLTVRLLKSNYMEKHPYELCAVKAGFGGASISCAPYDIGEKKSVAAALVGLNPTAADFVELHRLHDANWLTPPIRIYQRIKIENEGERAAEASELGLVFIVGAGKDAKSYATPSGGNWVFEKVLAFPGDRPATAFHRMQLARDEGDGTPVKLCTVRVGIEAAVIEECAELTPAGEAGKDVKPATDGAAK